MAFKPTAYPRMELKTTTFPQRNFAGFREARRLLELAPGQTITVLQAGPGLAVRFLGRLGGAWRLLERVVRRLPLPDSFFESYETADLLGAFDGIDVRLTIVDVNPRPLNVIAGQLRSADLRTIIVDLGAPLSPQLAPLAGTFDMVVAMAVVGRISPKERRQRAAANLAMLARQGGLIFANQGDFSSSGCVLVGPAIYRKS